MKNLSKAVAGIMILVALGVGSARAQYNNSSLKGCYGFLSNSVDSVPATATVGTICFDGNGNIIPNVGGLNETGWMQDSNGGRFFAVAEPGTYNIAPFPAQGMGTMTFANGCSYYLSMNNLFEYNVALGFQFVIYNYEACRDTAGDPKVLGGTAYIQQ